jgi:hypothetical protein
MALERAMPAAAQAEWTCPMHPQVRSDSPGACPKCGMALERREADAGEEEKAELADMTRRLRISAGFGCPCCCWA